MQQLAVLPGVEVFRHSILAPECDHVLPDLFRLLARDYLRHVRARLLRRPLARVDPFLGRHRRQLQRGRRPVRIIETRLHFGCVQRLELLVPHFRPNRHPRLIRQDRFRRAHRHLSRRVRHQVAEHLLPERGVGLVVVVEPHLPGPASRRGEHRGAAPAVIFRNQQRRDGAGSGIHIQQNRRARLGLADLLPTVELRQILPALQVAPGVLIQPRKDALLPGTRQLRRRLLHLMERAPVGRQPHRHQIGHGRVLITAVGKAGPPAHKQHPASAAVHKIVDELLLRRREVTGLHIVDHEALEFEQVFGFCREAVLQLLMILGRIL